MTDLTTVILSAIDNSNKKAVLNLNNNSEECEGSVRLYNFKDLHGILTLGFLIETEVYKAALTEKSNSFYTFSFKFPKKLGKFSCALINIQNGEPKPILLGSTEKSLIKDLSSNLIKNFQLLDNPKISIKEIENSLDSSDIDYCDEEKEEIEKTLNIECDKDKCSKCNYRTAFYKNCETSPSFPQTIKSEKINKPTYPLDNAGTFYNGIKDQLNILFDKYPEETFLTETIPSSKWIKVDYEDDGHYIVIGLIYEEDRVQYVCYGSPGEFSEEPPKEFNGLSQWLPLDPDKPEELGYWIIYQDAISGENVEIEVS